MIVNVLKDGTIKEDLRGHIVRREDAPALYEWLKKGAIHNADERREAGAAGGDE